MNFVSALNKSSFNKSNNNKSNNSNNNKSSFQFLLSVPFFPRIRLIIISNESSQIECLLMVYKVSLRRSWICSIFFLFHSPYYLYLTLNAILNMYVFLSIYNLNNVCCFSHQPFDMARSIKQNYHYIWGGFGPSCVHDQEIYFKLHLIDEIRIRFHIIMSNSLFAMHCVPNWKA